MDRGQQLIACIAADVRSMSNSSKSTAVVATIGCLSMLFALPLLAAAAIMIDGYVVMHLWRWFLVPLGLPAITYLHAAGISMLVDYMCPTIDLSDVTKKEDGTPITTMVTKIIGLIIIKPLIVLGIGSLLYIYMH